ncbi:MAG: hemerythrin domain-containing protein [Raineya sp.]|nr:hemerythrin domain-containing protein [Raineya sp.]
MILLITSMLSKQTISEIITQNFAKAYTLHTLGIPFYLHENDVLEQICEQKSLSLLYVEKLLQEDNSFKPLDTRKFKNAPLDTLISYLKYQHVIFLQKKIPFVKHLIEQLSAKDTQNQRLINDLQIMFPLFAEDFVLHTREEENNLFHYINALQESKSTQQYEFLHKYSLQAFAVAHDTHDDELEGIREITQDYALPADASLLLKVTFWHLQELEKYLKQHAYIENEILFPKALVLENEVKSQWSKRIQWN